MIKNSDLIILIVITLLFAYIIDHYFLNNNNNDDAANAVMRNIANITGYNRTVNRNTDTITQNPVNNMDTPDNNDIEAMGQKSVNFNYKIKNYEPMSKEECLQRRGELGLMYCPVENDHLAGAAYACGGINNMPSRFELQELAKYIYNNPTENPSIYGTRNDKELQRLGIYANDSHIFYWVGEEETHDDGVVRMFASRGSLIYRAPRDGSGYITGALGKVSFGNTIYIQTSRKNDSNLVGLPNNDVLLLICK